MPKSHLDAALTGHHLLKVIIVPKSIKAADSLKSWFYRQHTKRYFESIFATMSDMFNGIFVEIFMYLFSSFYLYHKYVITDLD